MKVVYCAWGENVYEDTIVCLQQITDNLVIIHEKLSGYLEGVIASRLISEITSDVDIVFSWDFMPIISDVCSIKNIKYVSYVYDWPNLTLYKKEVFNSCNRIYLFDKDGVNKLCDMGVKEVFHLPLGVLTGKFSNLMQINQYKHEVSFVGNLYPKLEEILPVSNIPDYIVGYLAAMCDIQQKIYGYNFVEEVITDELVKNSYIVYPGFVVPQRVILAEKITRATTGLERRRLLEAAGSVSTVDLYTYITQEELKNVIKHNPIAYNTEMPKVFRESKINLNITLRSITSGIPLRVLDILNVGGFCLTNYQPEIAELFEDGKELVMFSSEDDMKTKILYYLEHDEEREEIARNGYEKVKRDFSLLDRLSYIINDSCA